MKTTNSESNAPRRTQTILGKYVVVILGLVSLAAWAQLRSSEQPRPGNTSQVAALIEPNRSKFVEPQTLKAQKMNTLEAAGISLLPVAKRQRAINEFSRQAEFIRERHLKLRPSQADAADYPATF